MRPSCVLTPTMLVWNARCTLAAGASPETSKRFGAIVTLLKPWAFMKSATACACAWVGEYIAANCAGVNAACGLALNACSCASLRSLSETRMCIGWLNANGPVTTSPCARRVACMTAGAATVAAVPAAATARPRATTRAFIRNLLAITTSLRWKKTRPHTCGARDDCTRKNRECTLPARQLLSGPSFHLCEAVAIGGNIASATRRGCPGALTPEPEQSISAENPAHAAMHNVKCPGS